jgi:hypothetical protein
MKYKTRGERGSWAIAFNWELGGGVYSAARLVKVRGILRVKGGILCGDIA